VPPFPERLFLRIDQDKGESHFVVAGAPAYLTGTGETVKLGVYQLVEEGEARGTVDYLTKRKVAK
jgi:hypothetical protein